MTMLPLFLDRLSKERQAAFKELAKFAPPFVLAGGTAIMLQLGHRKSFDFDCFCEIETLPANLLQKIRRVLGNSIVVNRKTIELITLTTSTQIEITFVCHPYRPLRKPVKTPGIPLFHLEDLAANKAYTLGRRPAWRDYVDLFFFMKWKIYPIEKIIGLAEKKFGGGFNSKLFCQQLTYFDDVTIVETEFLKESYTAAKIQSFLGSQVKTYLKAALS